MLPYDDAERARFALRARLRDIIEHRDIPPAVLDGAKLLLAGPVRITDATGRAWYQWVATLRTSPAASRSADQPDPRPAVDDRGPLRRRAG